MLPQYSDQRLLRADGYSAQTRVPMDSWCVTREDLSELRKHVKQAVDAGRILPTERDPFDERHGPCVHVVVQTIIKPVTALAGGQSWALMLHPEGLKCDIFVTHGWAEGIYEFIDKVLYSWPRRAKHAYCCMLSNPQNLDITGMIANPSESPFAKALQSATYMLVVPNRKGSIYTRAWCTYEAYLAYQWQKDIIVASLATPGYWSHVCLSTFTSFVIAGMVVVVPDLNFVLGPVTSGIGIFVIAALEYYAPPGNILKLLNYAGLILGGASQGYCIRTLIDGANHCGLLAHGLHGLAVCRFLDWGQYVYDLLFFFVCSLGFGVSEGDNLQMAQHMHQRMLLRQGFSGYVQDSQSSVLEDKEAIMSEIGDKQDDVNRCIQLLLSAGTFNSDVREAALQGVNVERVGEVRWSLLVAKIGLDLANVTLDVLDFEIHFATITSYRYQELDVYVVRAATCFVEILLFAWLPRFRIVFMAKVHFKMALVNAFVEIQLACCFFVFSLFHPDYDIASITSSVPTLCHVVFSWITLCICLAGLARTTRIPIIGPCLAGFILSTDCKSCSKYCCASCFDATASNSQAASRTGERDGTEMVGNAVLISSCKEDEHPRPMMHPKSNDHQFDDTN